MSIRYSAAMAQEELSALVQKLRRDYLAADLTEDAAEADPFVQFKKWFSEATAAALTEPNAMMLATVGEGGKPSARAVLMKDFTPEGVVFFTNYQSRKGSEIDANPNVAVLFLWHELERQVRIEGAAKKVARAVSEKYFSSRPRGAQLGALCSAQSETIPGRSALEQSYKKEEQRHDGHEIACPEWWGGYCIVPSRFEFWQGRSNRLHDRLVYERTSGGWSILRLAP